MALWNGEGRFAPALLLLLLAVATTPDACCALDWSDSDRLSLAYGGILSMFDDEASATSEDVVEAVAAAVRHLLQRGGGHLPSGTAFHRRLPRCLADLQADVQPTVLASLPRIRLLSRHYLRFTSDGVAPFVYRFRAYGPVHIFVFMCVCVLCVCVCVCVLCVAVSVLSV